MVATYDRSNTRSTNLQKTRPGRRRILTRENLDDARKIMQLAVKNPEAAKNVFDVNFPVTSSVLAAGGSLAYLLALKKIHSGLGSPRPSRFVKIQGFRVKRKNWERATQGKKLAARVGMIMQRASKGKAKTYGRKYRMR